ncbi:MAG TPA: DUF3352 domain-containing protein [Actinomycetota bacterium]|nr:DUF3352 domain-containing protein [Actinomycetota bacterium]
MSGTGRARRWLVVVLAALLVVGGGGSAAAFLLMRGAGEELLQLVPASSEVVVTAYLDPSAGQKVNLMALADRFPALRDDQGVRQQVDVVLDAALEGVGLSHEDVRPWLGSQVAVVVDIGANEDVPTVSFLVASKDDDAAQEALDKALQGSLGDDQTSEYRGATMHVFGSGTSSVGYVIVDHVVVLSNHSIGLTRVIDVSDGTTQAIADDPAFLDTISSLPEGKLALAYVNPAEIVQRAFSATGLGVAGTAPGLDQLRAIRGVGATLSAHPDGLAFDVAVRMDPSKLDPATRLQLDQPVHENGVLGFVPADSYVVATQQGVDETLKQSLDQIMNTSEGELIRERIGLDDTLAALTGDVAFEVGPGGLVPAGAIVLGVRDPSAVQHTLDGLADLVLTARSRAEAPAFGNSSGSKHHHVQRAVPEATWRTSTYQDTTIRYLDDPDLSGTGFVPAYAVVDGAAIVASSPTEIRKLIDTGAGSEPNIGASSGYERAVARVPDGGSIVYLDVAAMVSRFGSQLPPDIASNLEPFKTVVQGTSNSSSLVTYRLFIEIG